MSRRWKPSVTLIATGIIVPDLHFGPFLRNWWHVRILQENGTKIEQYYPFRVGMKIQVELKNRLFIIRVVQGNKHNNLLPGFLSLMMGIEDNNILDELVSDLSFQPFMISIQQQIKKINIMIYSIGMPAKQGAGCGFTSSFIYFKSKECALFFQTVNENRYSIRIYKENQFSEEFHGLDPNSVWKKIDILKEWSGVTLFSLDNSSVKKKLEQVSSHTIHNAKIHGRVFGHRCSAVPKPPMRKKIMPQEHKDQFE
ncbi:13916_t:CDS:2 [Funneliformis caledonium]|uniref:13916_t:CDS:1 n=1 Tax=Funneliformis caledonium TaxID=1117310 RepID=A0A9N9I909_9GLOM|nr:13916_t:CDS:2 [Funneliformis caledonium]